MKDKNRKNITPGKFSRRSFIRYSLEVGLVFGMVGGIHALSRDGTYVRPPGSIQVEAFTAACIRCSICVEVCPTNAVRLLDLSGDIKNISTPVIDPDFGGCSHWLEPCLKCADNCPTIAIDRDRVLDGYKIASVRLEADKCVNCMVWFERCPVEGAMMFPNPDGGDPYTRLADIPVSIRLVHSPHKPFINPDKCAGCGLCVHYCPEKIMYLEPLGVHA